MGLESRVMSRRRLEIVKGMLCAAALGGLLVFYLDQIYYPYNHGIKPTDNQVVARKHDEESWISKDAAGFFTACLAFVGVVQAGLFFWQLRLIRLSLADTKATAEAANKSATVAERALKELEAPRVFVDVIDTGLEVMDGTAHLATGVQFRYRVTNYGRTPALLTEVCLRYPILSYGETPAEINPSKVPGRGLPTGVVSALNNPYDERENLVSQIDVMKLYEELSFKKYALFFYGYVRYEDIFGERYITGFCHLFDGLHNRFVRSGNKRFNYFRKDDIA
jgi:hypothetical protein